MPFELTAMHSAVIVLNPNKLSRSPLFATWLMEMFGEGLLIAS